MKNRGKQSVPVAIMRKKLSLTYSQSHTVQGIDKGNGEAEANSSFIIMILIDGSKINDGMLIRYIG